METDSFFYAKKSKKVYDLCKTEKTKPDFFRQDLSENFCKTCGKLCGNCVKLCSKAIPNDRIFEKPVENRVDSFKSLFLEFA